MATFIPWLIDTVAQRMRRARSGQETIDPLFLPSATTTEPGMVELADAAPPTIGTAGAVGTSTDVAREDHTHAHGVQTDETLHALAVADTSDGFISAEGQATVEEVDRELPRIQAVVAAGGVPDYDEESFTELLWQIGNNSWRCGMPTSETSAALGVVRYLGVYFYAEMPSTLSVTLPYCFSGSSTTTPTNVALYTVIGVPNEGAPNRVGPAVTEPVLNASMYWDDGVPIPPNTFVNGAMLEIELFGQIKVGRTTAGDNILWLVLDPDGDVRLSYEGDNLTLATEAHKVVGAESGVSTGTKGDVGDNGSGDIEITLIAHGLNDGDLVWIHGADKAVAPPSNIEDGGLYYVANKAADTFELSTTYPSLTLVPYAAGGQTEVVVTTSTSSGSWKQVKFGFELTETTPNNDFQPVHIHIVGVADGASHETYGDTENGVRWYVTMERVPNADRIGQTPARATVAPVSLNSMRWVASATRTLPIDGDGYDAATPAIATAAPLILAHANYTGTGTAAFYSSAHDYGGNWDEVCTDRDVEAASGIPLHGLRANFNTALVTLLKVGGVYVGEVLEVLNGRRLVRYRVYKPHTRIKYGDTVTWEQYRRMTATGALSTTPMETGSFTAVAVRIGPQMTNLSIRAAMTGDQDGVNVLDIDSATARLTYNRRRG
jgi:hypothetical protein